METFKKRLKELRTDKKISQKGLASVIGTNNSSICDWECGRSEPSIETILKLCDFFGVSADYLLGRED
ncbi:MAG: helix-turn-helix transcriptional regulator [Clostridia bacterium]|nr:helix-turn-helix transcriptional regulator [Clostridia bacterium]